MSNIDEKAKNNFTIEMRILFCSMNARDVLFSGFLCVVYWYALNVCRKKILVCVFKVPLNTKA